MIVSPVLLESIQQKPISSIKDQFIGFMGRHKVELLAGALFIAGVTLICLGAGGGGFADMALSQAVSNTALAATGIVFLVEASFVGYAALKDRVETMPQDGSFFDIDETGVEDFSSTSASLEDIQESEETLPTLPPPTKPWITPGRIIGALVLASAAYYYFGRGESSPLTAPKDDNHKIIERGREMLESFSYDLDKSVSISEVFTRTGLEGAYGDGHSLNMGEARALYNTIIQTIPEALNSVQSDMCLDKAKAASMMRSEIMEYIRSRMKRGAFFLPILDWWNHGAVNKGEFTYLVGKYGSEDLNPQGTCDRIISAAQRPNPMINAWAPSIGYIENAFDAAASLVPNKTVQENSVASLILTGFVTGVLAKVGSVCCQGNKEAGARRSRPNLMTVGGVAAILSTGVSVAALAAPFLVVGSYALAQYAKS